MNNLDVKALRTVFALLQGHYPERLSQLWFLNAPWIFWGERTSMPPNILGFRGWISIVMVLRIPGQSFMAITRELLQGGCFKYPAHRKTYLFPSHSGGNGW